jgi:hypothetical protein
MSTCLVISLRKKTGKSGIASILTSPLKSHIRFPRTSSEVSKPESLYMCLIWKKLDVIILSAAATLKCQFEWTMHLLTEVLAALLCLPSSSLRNS